MNSFSSLFIDIWVITKRNLMRYVRLPQLIVFTFVQPIMFVLLFAYVFGGAINTGVDYVNYLLPGILVQTVLFGSMQTGVGLTEDLARGMIDRFRSLPMSRMAILAGRTIADMLRNILVLALMALVGYLIGFRPAEFGPFILAMLVTLLFSFAFSWLSATIGLLVKSAEAAQSVGFIWVFPLVFASSIFVPLETMKPGIRAFAEHNPISYVVNVVRDLCLGMPLDRDLWYAFIWIAAILIVFIPFSVYRFKKIT
jgi:ABC-2 type transport system permease protein